VRNRIADVRSREIPVRLAGQDAEALVVMTLPGANSGGAPLHTVSGRFPA
jgi:hypothetical protein